MYTFWLMIYSVISYTYKSRYMNCTRRLIDLFRANLSRSASLTILGSIKSCTLRDVVPSSRIHRYLALSLQYGGRRYYRGQTLPRNTKHRHLARRDYGCNQVAWILHLFPFSLFPVASFSVSFPAAARIFYLYCRSPRESITHPVPYWFRFFFEIYSCQFSAWSAWNFVVVFILHSFRQSIFNFNWIFTFVVLQLNA